MKIVHNVFLFTLFLVPFGSFAMHDEAQNSLDRLSSNMVETGLAVCGETRSVNDLIQVKPEEISCVEHFSNIECENYSASLAGGDGFSADRLADGTIYCTRFVKVCDGSGRCFRFDLPLDARYFFMLKALYEKSQHEEKTS